MAWTQVGLSLKNLGVFDNRMPFWRRTPETKGAWSNPQKGGLEGWRGENHGTRIDKGNSWCLCYATGHICTCEVGKTWFKRARSSLVTSFGRDTFLAKMSDTVSWKALGKGPCVVIVDQPRSGISQATGVRPARCTKSSLRPQHSPSLRSLVVGLMHLNRVSVSFWLISCTNQDLQKAPKCEDLGCCGSLKTCLGQLLDSLVKVWMTIAWQP